MQQKETKLFLNECFCSVCIAIVLVILPDWQNPGCKQWKLQHTAYEQVQNFNALWYDSLGKVSGMLVETSDTHTRVIQHFCTIEVTNFYCSQSTARKFPSFFLMCRISRIQ